MACTSCAHQVHILLPKVLSPLYETDKDPTVLVCQQITDEDHHPILREEVETAVKALKTKTSASVDDTQAE